MLGVMHVVCHVWFPVCRCSLCGCTCGPAGGTSCSPLMQLQRPVVCRTMSAGTVHAWLYDAPHSCHNTGTGSSVGLHICFYIAVGAQVGMTVALHRWQGSAGRYCLLCLSTLYVPTRSSCQLLNSLWPSATCRLHIVKCPAQCVTQQCCQACAVPAGSWPVACDSQAGGLVSAVLPVQEHRLCTPPFQRQSLPQDLSLGLYTLPPATSPDPVES